MNVDDVAQDVHRALTEGGIISDEAAREIASWWWAPNDTHLGTLVDYGREALSPEQLDTIASIDARHLADMSDDPSVNFDDLTALTTWARHHRTGMYGKEEE